MNHIKAITEILERQSGIVTTAQINAAGIPRLYLSKMTAKSFYKRSIAVFTQHRKPGKMKCSYCNTNTAKGFSRTKRHFTFMVLATGHRQGL